MIQTTVQVEGMACSMCEARVNDAIRRAFPVKKVSSNAKKGTTVIVSEEALDEAELKRAIDATGYTFRGMTQETAKGGLFSRFF